MAVDVQFAQRVEFAPFELDLRTTELFKQGRKLRLSGQAARLLVLLVQRAGDLVTREELRAALWQQDTFVDFDHGLNNSINRVREVLGDSAALRNGALRRLTDHPALDYDPFITSDSEHLVWSSNRSGNFEIWVAERGVLSPPDQP